MKKIEAALIPFKIKQELDMLPNKAGIYSLLEQNSMGDIFSTSSIRYVLLKSTAAYCYLAGELEDSDVRYVVGFLKRYTEIKLVCHERHHNKFLNLGMRICGRIELIFQGTFASINSLPSVEAKLIASSEEGRNCPWYGFITDMFGSEEIFLRNGFGVAITQKNKVVSAAYAACIGSGQAELAIKTDPDYEGRGFGSLAVNHCIQECLHRQLIPTWSCNIDNKSSLRVALKNGFQLTRYYAFLNL